MTQLRNHHNNINFCYESSNRSCPKHDYSASVRVPLYILLGAVIVLTVCGNLLVIITVAQSKQLHSPTNYLVLSLAVVDFLLGAIIMPPSMVRSLETCWYLGNIFCQIHTSTDIMLSTISILNLSLISIDRYFAVCQPLHYRTKITNTVIVTLILTCWSLSFFIGFGMIFLGFTSWGTNAIYNGSFHCEGSCFLLQNRMSSLVSSVLAFVMPALLIIVLYVKIFIIARKQACAIQSRVCANVKLEKGKTRLIKTEPKATRTLGIVLGFYLSCWAPLFMCNLINPGVSSLFLPEILMWLAYLNSGINTVIYAFSFSWFRKPFKRIFLQIFNVCCENWKGTTH